MEEGFYLVLFYRDLVEPKHNLDSCSKDVVVNALKQITQKRYVLIAILYNIVL